MGPVDIMDRAGMRDYARKIVRIDVNDVSDPDMDAFLDEGYDRVMMHTTWEWAKSLVSEDVVLVPGQNEYATIGDVVQITSVQNTDRNYSLRSISKNELDSYLNAVITTTDPTHFYWVDGTQLIFPSASTTDTLAVQYITIPLFGNGDTDEPVFNHIFHRILVDWCLHRLWEMEEDFDKSTEYRARFEEGIARMTAWYNDLMKDTPNIYGESNLRYRPTNMPFLDDARF
jgi:hypothetical protein